jgi:hypothetical protein
MENLLKLEHRIYSLIEFYGISTDFNSENAKEYDLSKSEIVNYFSRMKNIN